MTRWEVTPPQKPPSKRPNAQTAILVGIALGLALLLAIALARRYLRLGLRTATGAGPSREETLTLQQRLTDAGCYQDAIDGAKGAALDEAVKDLPGPAAGVADRLGVSLRS